MHPKTATHNSTTMGGMTAMVVDHACTGRMFDVRSTQSAESESPIAVALATAYIWNIVTTARGQASGNAVGKNNDKGKRIRQE